MPAYRGLKLSAVISAATLLTGCSFGATVDSLLVPPSLSQEQEQIYQALQNAAGKDIKLQYPKTGDYLSAFILSDLDGDNAEEALVFYEKTGISAAENNLRINVLVAAEYSKARSLSGAFDPVADSSVLVFTNPGS